MNIADFADLLFRRLAERFPVSAEYIIQTRSPVAVFMRILTDGDHIRFPFIINPLQDMEGQLDEADTKLTEQIENYYKTKAGPTQ